MNEETVEWLVLKKPPISVMVAVAGSEKIVKYVEEGSSSAEKTLEKARDALYDALELLKSCKTKRCSKQDFDRIERLCYYVGVKLYDDDSDS